MISDKISPAGTVDFWCKPMYKAARVPSGDNVSETMTQENDDIGHQDVEDATSAENLYHIELGAIVSRLTDAGQDPNIAKVTAQLFIERAYTAEQIATGLAKAATKEDLVEMRGVIVEHLQTVLQEVVRITAQLKDTANKNDVEKLEGNIDQAIRTATTYMDKIFASREHLDDSVSTLKKELLEVLATKNELETAHERLSSEQRVTNQRIESLEQNISNGQQATEKRIDDLKEVLMNGQTATNERITTLDERNHSSQKENAKQFAETNSKIGSLLMWLCIILIPGFLTLAGLIIALADK